MTLNELLKNARDARIHSYSPYSKFQVGAAVLADDGKVYVGTNIENASYGLSICAERSAIFNAISAGNKKIVSIAVSCPQSSHTNSMMPCGACLQVISEFSTDDTTVSVEAIGNFKITDLLRYPFRISDK
tara:strand:+ start:21 stop:410 length:390 start_codon:yes stop_codon:yes gene_type:complete